MRPIFFDAPEDPDSWLVEDEMMFGPNLLVAPVLYEGQTERNVYFPKDSIWIDVYNHKQYDGGTKVCMPITLGSIPVFTNNEELLRYFDEYRA
jgi:alpha-D-xyloside xylohydrolase